MSEKGKEKQVFCVGQGEEENFRCFYAQIAQV